ncbi:fungal-specific transcription factor domain-containing protein [Fusarium oxysporum f. sp. albedinis]|nr:fungal-specific transcription factor domain-containing protein [Fusarium oxysporum f. sp. albedinis]
MALSSHQRIRTVPGSCWTCKNRRILCDLTKPVCRRCIEVGSSCQYSQVTLKRPLRLVPHVPAAFQPIAFPAGLSSTLEEKAFSYFHRRLWPLLTAVDDQITFPLDPVINNQVVRVVICLLAESHRFLQDRRNNPPDTVRKRRECIEAVNKEIDRCSSDINANMQPLLFAILLLYFYEGYIECPWWSHSTLIHQNGIQATITRMGGLQRVLKSGHTSLHVLLSLFATAELTTRMLRGGVPSISPRSWRLFSPGPAWWQEHLPDNTPSSEPCLGNIMEYMSDIVCYRQFLIDNEALPSTEVINGFERALQPSFAPFGLVETVSQESSTESLLISHYAFLRAYQHTAYIFLYRGVCNLPTTHPLVQQHVDACLDAIDRVSRSSKAVNCLVFPLCVAGSHVQTVQRQRHILKVLFDIQNTIKFASLQQIIQFLESCWKIEIVDSSWLEVFVSLNSNIISF